MRLAKLLFGVLLILVNFNLVAEEIADIYHVEIIAFAQTDSKRFSAEQWPKYVGELNTKGAIKLNSIKTSAPESIDALEIMDALDEVGSEPVSEVIKQSVTIVEPNKYLLQNEAKAIKSAKDKRFIKQVAWMQPLAGNVKSTPIVFEFGKELAGVITIKPLKNQYNVEVDMIYHSDQSVDHNPTDIEQFRINRSVKAKKKEVFYIDHPLVGLLIVISPVFKGM